MLLQIAFYILLFALMLSIVDAIKEAILFAIALMNGTRYEMGKLRGWLLAVSISYILTFLFARNALTLKHLKDIFYILN